MESRPDVAIREVQEVGTNDKDIKLAMKTIEADWKATELISESDELSESGDDDSEDESSESDDDDSENESNGSDDSGDEDDYELSETDDYDD